MITADRPSPLILCVGMPVRDLVLRIDTLPSPGRKIRASEFDQICGGNAPNAAVAIARLGGRVRLTGPVGESTADTQPVFALLDREGIDLSHMVHVPGATTPVSSIMIDAAGERTVVTYRDPKLWNVILPEADTLLDGVDAVLTESRCSDFVAPLCRQARRRGLPVVLDADRVMTLDEEVLALSTHVIFSAEALHATAGSDDFADALARIAGLTPAFLGVTRGADGVDWLDAQHRLQRVPSFPITPIDTLGAGDVFHGAFTLAIAEGQSITRALRFGSAAAALKCARFGSAFATPQRLEVEALLADA
ncbi:sugar kinase [Bradyrhizobium sp. 2TAF24]|uniref:sugar kinase n=1 Tax=Bradyrhizobium sp. 2TAF24 TaxID=3233011 RepID=UPI003F8DDD14